MKQLKFLAVAALALVSVALSGCATESQTKVERAPGQIPTIARNARLYIGYAQNISVKGEPVIDSGRVTMDELRKAFAKYAAGTYAGRRPETLEEAKLNAAKMGARYLVWPTVMRWEDRATEWSGRRDKIQVRLELWDVAEERLLDFRVIDGVSGWLSDGGDLPQHLLKDPFEKYAESFFAAPTYMPSQMPPVRPRGPQR